MITNIPLPDKMAHLPLWKGIPMFYVLLRAADGRPLFRHMSRTRQVEAANKNLCHICGTRMTPPFWFICGEAEHRAKKLTNGPMHEECAKYSARACPFLSNPNFKGSEDVLAEANPAAVSYLIEHGLDGPVVRPDKIALCTSLIYRADLRAQIPWFLVKAWEMTDWDFMPQKERRPT